MKTPFDDAIAKLVALANEGFSRGWDKIDRADKIDAIADAIGGVHAEWMQLVEQRNMAVAACREVVRQANGIHDQIHENKLLLGHGIHDFLHYCIGASRDGETTGPRALIGKVGAK